MCVRVTPKQKGYIIGSDQFHIAPGRLNRCLRISSPKKRQFGEDSVRCGWEVWCFSPQEYFGSFTAKQQRTTQLVSRSPRCVVHLKIVIITLSVQSRLFVHFRSGVCKHLGSWGFCRLIRQIRVDELYRAIL